MADLLFDWSGLDKTCKSLSNSTQVKHLNPNQSENTYLLCKGKYHCTADLLFDWFEFDKTCKSLSNST